MRLRGFHVDWLTLRDGSQMTATEVLQRRDERLRLLGPVVSRMQAEFQGPLIEGRDETEPPVLNSEAERIRALLEDAPARFEIEDNSDADPSYGVRRSVHAAGAIAVRLNEAVIEREAEAQGVDADLVKAIMYVENVHGWYGHGAEALGIAKSLFPMNIKPDPWAAIENPPADLGDPATNIRIAVTLIRRISERIDEPTPAKVASIWIFTGRELVNDYGARVQDAYENRLWDFEHDPTEMP